MNRDTMTPLQHTAAEFGAPVAEQWHPLSSNQRAFWFQYQLQPALQGCFNLHVVARMEPAVAPGRLQGALNALAARHAMLRARFALINGEPMQAAQPAVEVPVRVQAVASLEEAELWPLIQSDRETPFDLQKAPLIRASLYRATPDACVLLIVMDHIVSDGWTQWQMIEELGQLLKSDPAEALAEPAPASGGEFFDYVAQQRDWLESPQGRRQFEYWRSELSEDFAELQLPADTRASTEARATLTRPLPAVLTNQLRGLAERHACSTFTVLLAGFYILLGRLSGQDELAVGSAMPARSATWARTMGCFTNPVVLRAVMDGQMTVVELLKQVQSKAWRALKNQNFPLSELVQRLKPARSHMGQPYYRALFVGQKARDAEQTVGLLAHAKSVGQVPWGDFQLSAFGEVHNTGGAGLDLLMEYIELGDHIIAALEYDASRFSAATIERWLACWECILESMAADEGQCVHTLNMLPAAERAQVLHGWNDTTVDIPHDKCVHELFEQRAKHSPESVAVHADGQTVSYGELNTRANQLAAYLLELGVRPDDRVAVCCPRGLPMLVSLLAVWKAGAAYLPLDPAYPADRIAYMLADSQSRVVLTQGTGHCVAAHLPAGAVVLDVIQDRALWQSHGSDNRSPAALGLQAAHLAYVIYTSGSTGQPKGVMVEHHALVNYALDAVRWFKLGEQDVVLQQNSLNFDLSIEEIVPALLAGAALAPSEALFGLAPGSVRPSVVHLTAAHWHTLVGEWSEDPCQAKAHLGGVRLVNVTGDALAPHKLQQWQSLRPDGTELINTYGPTEATVSCSAAYVEHDPSVLRVSIGKPFANTSLYVLDAHLQPVAVGVVGELYIGGRGVARGYLNLPELTAQRFVPDPFSTDAQARLYKTGDLVRWRSDGEVEYVGRNDFQVKVRGFRVELGEIEIKLAGCTGVSEVVVLAQAAAGGQKQLVAYVTGPAKEDALRAHAQKVLPQYMQPQTYVKLDALPKTAGGKLDRKALPAPQVEERINAADQAPQGPLEEAIAAIWCDVLGLAQIGRDDNFFDLGGHSLMAVKMLTRIRSAFEVEIDLASLFSRPTIAHLEPRIVDLQLAQFDPEELARVLETECLG